MARMERTQVSAYVYSQIAEELKASADEMGLSNSAFVECLLRWGVRAMTIESMRQGTKLPLDQLGVYLVEQAPSWAWGPIAPSLSVEEEIKIRLDHELRDVQQKLAESEPAADALAVAVRQVIAEMRANGEI